MTNLSYLTIFQSRSNILHFLLKLILCQAKKNQDCFHIVKPQRNTIQFKLFMVQQYFLTLVKCQNEILAYSIVCGKRRKWSWLQPDLMCNDRCWRSRKLNLTSHFLTFSLRTSIDFCLVINLKAQEFEGATSDLTCNVVCVYVGLDICMRVSIIKKVL